MQNAEVKDEIRVGKRWVEMSTAERLEYHAEALEELLPCPYTRDVLLTWIAAELASGRHKDGADLDIAYEDWVNPGAWDD
ncbi:hypothetical protein HX137_02940 [Pseudomonas sp. 165]|uniref:hypothetical protein n=1 Tax=Pseudomonas sp. 165 TaxID=2746722 RepID=UPI002575F3AC|nr:hypothetical protein [Pseudomonas sp. 165]MDM1709590.1 hypothetical protein [Pseudomonas sp. 165]